MILHLMVTLYKTEMEHKEKQKYRGMFETQKSGNKKSSGDIGLNIRTLASPKVGQDQVFGGVSVPCWHATPTAFIPLKPLQVGKVNFSECHISLLAIFLKNDSSRCFLINQQFQLKVKFCTHLLQI